MARQDEIILEMKDVKVHFHLDEGVLKAVDGIDLRIKRGKTLGIVGESGCGKSVTSQALLRIVPKPGEVQAKSSFTEAARTAARTSTLSSWISTEK